MNTFRKAAIFSAALLAWPAANAQIGTTEQLERAMLTSMFLGPNDDDSRFAVRVLGQRYPKDQAICDVVAERMLEYRELGIETFILSGYPHLEEAYRTAESLFPLLPIERRATVTTHSLTGPFGEMIANEIPPASRQAQS